MENLTPSYLTSSFSSLFSDCEDVQIKRFVLEDSSDDAFTLIYCDGLVDSKEITHIILPKLEQIFMEQGNIENIQFLNVSPVQHVESTLLAQLVFKGQLLLYLENGKKFYALDIANPPNRKPEESTMEVSIKGAKDSFTEDLRTNVALIRKRMHSTTLSYKKFVIGTRTNTDIGLLYVKDLVKPEIIQEASKRLENLNTEAPTLAMLEQALGDRTYSFFPLVDSTTRPDSAVRYLLNSRFVVLLDGTPMATIAPASLATQLKSSEDAYLHFWSVSFERLLRFMAFMFSIFAPGFWVALTAFHPEQLPFPLLATVAVSRMGVPFSTAVEAFLIQIMFELFREAGLRLPKAVGQTVSVVGGLIIGDAAIRAGLTSPSLLVVTGVSAVASFSVINPALAGALIIFKFFVMILSSFFGMFGFIGSVILITLYLTNLTSFGVSYLTPFAPFQIRELIQGLLARPQLYADDKPTSITQKRR